MLTLEKFAGITRSQSNQCWNTKKFFPHRHLYILYNSHIYYCLYSEFQFLYSTLVAAAPSHQEVSQEKAVSQHYLPVPTVRWTAVAVPLYSKYPTGKPTESIKLPVKLRRVLNMLGIPLFQISPVQQIVFGRATEGGVLLQEAVNTVYNARRIGIYYW